MHTHTHTWNSFARLGPMRSNSVQRHIQYNIVQQTMVTHIHSKGCWCLDIFSKIRPYILDVYSRIFKKLLSVSVIITNLCVNGRCSLKLFPSPHHSLKSHPFGLCSFFLFSFCCFCSLYSLLEEIWVIFYLFLSTSCLSQIFGKWAGKENTVFRRWVRSSF